VRAVILTAVLSGALACRGGDVATGEPGTPLSRLRPEELRRFEAGRALFNKVYTAAEGLGPTFNENQCSACHTRPASGGSSGFERVVKAARFTPPPANTCDALTAQGGDNVRSQATSALRARGVAHETIPTAATGVGHFAPPFLFGLGLVEAVPDRDILQREDPDDRDHDGISGRAGRTRDGRLARLGRKAEFGTIREFTESALHGEMGLTTPSDTVDRIAGQPVPRNVDPARDPEVSDASVDLLATFVRFLAPPAPVTPGSPAQRDTLTQGRRVFTALGCPACHTPALRTARSDVPALDRRIVPLYSDLLLHDMGPALADVCGRTAAPAELRTEPLMGLGQRDRFLHDGRTIELRDAILAHGGEAQKSRDTFARLSWLQQEFVVRFLRSR
jgi:CxxC motif-containing protein (DUF1111 family)